MIFKIRAALTLGGHHAFLNDRTLSAHPEEEEYLLGTNDFQVTQIKDMKAYFEGKPFRVTVIFISDPFIK